MTADEINQTLTPDEIRLVATGFSHVIMYRDGLYALDGKPLSAAQERKRLAVLALMARREKAFGKNTPWLAEFVA